MNKLFGLVLMGLAMLSGSAKAALVDRGNGMIYDSLLGITWLQDANYAMTSGYDSDGRMTWSQAMAWADGLSYGGYEDWRLPNVNTEVMEICTTHGGVPYCDIFYDFYRLEYSISWYPLIGPNILETDVEILNFESDGTYWSGNMLTPDPVEAEAWRSNGAIITASEFNEYYAWAVRSGDVAVNPVPLPGSLVLMLVGLAGIETVRQRLC